MSGVDKDLATSLEGCCLHSFLHFDSEAVIVDGSKDFIYLAYLRLVLEEDAPVKIGDLSIGSLAD